MNWRRVMPVGLMVSRIEAFMSAPFFLWCYGRLWTHSEAWKNPCVGKEGTAGKLFPISPMVVISQAVFLPGRAAPLRSYRESSELSESVIRRKRAMRVERMDRVRNDAKQTSERDARFS